MATGSSAHLFKDFAHAPSKVKATVQAVSDQFEGFTTIGCLELHTYSSLDPVFLPQYKSSLDALDEAIVFYDPEALEIKGRPAIEPADIQAAFQHHNLKGVYNTKRITRLFVEEELCYIGGVDDEFWELWKP